MLMKSTWLKSVNLLIRRFTSTTNSAESISIIQWKLKDMVAKGLYGQALDLYKKELHCAGLHENSFIIPTIVKACSFSFDYHVFGLQLQTLVLKSGLDYDPVICNAFISLYDKSLGDMELALKVFDSMPVKDTISWNSIINCCIRSGYFAKAFETFKEMHKFSFVPKPELIASVISTSVGLGYFKLGRAIHALVIVDEKIEEEVYLLTSLIDCYFKCGDSSMGLKLFDRMEIKNEVSWTVMISGCVANLDYDLAFDCFRAMQITGVRPNRATLIAILPACAELSYVNYGKEIHGYALRLEFVLDHHFASLLVHVYCRSKDSLQLSKLIFKRSEVKDVVMWSSIIGSYSRNGNGIEAMKLFRQMREEGIEPNSVTLLAIISACTILASLKHGNAIHTYIVKCGFNSDVFICNALINMYSKCGCLVASHQVFKEMHMKDLVSWSSLIAGYGLHGNGKEALCLFREMRKKGVEPDAIALLSVLSACNHAGLVEEAQQIFKNIKDEGNIPLSMEHYACQIDLLGKSGEIDYAFDIIQTMPMKPSAMIWSSLLSACRTHGRLELAEAIAPQLIKSEPGNAANYTLLSMIYAESGNWSSVEEVRRHMTTQRLNKCYGYSQILVQNHNSRN